MLLPLRSGNGNRADLQQITDSLLNARGDAVTKATGSIVWTEVVAHARAIYHIWAYNQIVANQFVPDTMSVALERWETMLGLAALPNDTIRQRQIRIAAKLLLIGKIPNTQAVRDLLSLALGATFLALIDTPAADGYASFPGGTSIVGGVGHITDGPWQSSLQAIFIEAKHLPYQSDSDFYNTVNQVAPLLNSFLPAYDTFSWFWNGFCDDGYGHPTPSTITVAVNGTTVTGVGTAWATPINAATNTYNVEPGSIIEAYDDTGVWVRMTVDHVVNNTQLVLTSAVARSITSQLYVIQGFFLDCDEHSFPYPPAGCRNLDNAAFNKV